MQVERSLLALLFSLLGLFKSLQVDPIYLFISLRLIALCKFEFSPNACLVLDLFPSQLDLFVGVACVHVTSEPDFFLLVRFLELDVHLTQQVLFSQPQLALGFS